MRKIFNITEKDMDILPHLAKQPNMSRYIIDLIRKDMEMETIYTEEKIIEIIDKYLSVKHSIVNISNEQFPIESVLDILSI